MDVWKKNYNFINGIKLVHVVVIVEYNTETHTIYMIQKKIMKQAQYKALILVYSWSVGNGKTCGYKLQQEII